MLVCLRVPRGALAGQVVQRAPLVHWLQMATRISAETAARIEKAWPYLLDALAAGEVMAPVYKAAGLTADQVRVWRVAGGPERATEWDSAREQSADAYADRAVEVANNPGVDSGIARVRLDALKWLASKRNPRQYSDKATLDVNVRTVDLTRIIEAANARLLAARQVGQIVEGEVLKAGAALALPSLENLL